LTIDLAVVGIVFALGLFGLMSGAIKQIAHLGGLVAGWLLSRPLALVLGPLAAKKFGYPLLLTTIGLSFVAFFAIYIVTVLLVRLVLARVFPAGEHGWLNRLGGFFLGAAKAAAIAFVVLSGLVFVESFLVSVWSDWAKEAKQSLALRLVRHHGLFSSLPAVGGLEKILKLARDPSSAANLAQDPDFQALAKDPRVRAMVDDAGIRHALAEGDSAELLSSVRVLDVLNDPKLVERLTRFESGTPAPKSDPTPATSPAPRPKSRPEPPH